MSGFYTVIAHYSLAHCSFFLCGERSSKVEHQIVDLVAGGSSPLAHPIFGIGCINPASSIEYQADAPVAQLDRATDFESVGRRFESSRACSSSGGERRIWGRSEDKVGR